jgi:methyltransferase (TIGR00027 family)
MQIGQPSQTALGAAAHRAVHQSLEGGVIFADPFALQILGDDARTRLSDMAGDPAHRPMRLFIAARSRFSEDTMAACVVRGVRQIVVLGAGLDTFSLRNPHAELGARVFEVDYPATQAWKRERLRQAGLDLPATLTFAPVDFERQSLLEGLSAAGFRADQPAYFQWLGVVPYLTREAIVSTLDLVAGIAGSEVVFDYSEPFENLPPAMRANVAAIAERAASIGEPWLSLFNPADMAALLQARRFGEFRDVTRAELAQRYYGVLGEGLTSGPGPHVVRAQSAAGVT